MEAAPATRVLLVEDEITDALVVQRSLRRRARARERFALAHAPTLAQGIEHLHRSAVDVLLLDLSLPDSDGPATVARLRERDGGVPLVVLTGDGDPRLVAGAFEAGADEYLVKGDVQAPLLRRTIRHAIERRRARPRPPPESLAPGAPDAEAGLLHALKNLLTSILGNAQLLRREVPEGGFLASRAEGLLAAARAASHIVRGLAEGPEPRDAAGAVDLCGFVDAAKPLLRALLPERVALRCEPGPRGARVGLPPETLRRALVELVVNAAEAIGDGDGRVEIRTGQAVLADGDVRRCAAPTGIGPGPCAWLEVRDDGGGFDAATCARLFESGFSTKGPGRGHGLAQIRETLARHGAGLRVEAHPGSGSAFRILLPARG